MLRQPPSRKLIVIDALDECDDGPDRDNLVGFLGTAIPRTTTIVLSRQYWNISFKASLGDEGSYFHVDLDEEEDMQSDLKAFTTERMTSLIQNRPNFAAHKEEMIRQVFNRASNGMFLMVELLIHLLGSSDDSSALGIEKVIASLPNTLQDIYRKIWRSISREKARKG